MIFSYRLNISGVYMKKIIITVLIIAAVFSFASCDLLGGGWFLPQYIGTWAAEETLTSPFEMTMKTTYTLAREEWESIIQIKGDDDIWYDFFAYRGTLTAEGATLTMALTHEKIADSETMIIAADTPWTEVPEADAGTPGTSSWAVSGDELTLTTASDTEGGDPHVLVLTKVAE